jgi:hypothetical protein
MNFTLEGRRAVHQRQAIGSGTRFTNLPPATLLLPLLSKSRPYRGVRRQYYWHNCLLGLAECRSPWFIDVMLPTYRIARSITCPFFGFGFGTFDV